MTKCSSALEPVRCRERVSTLRWPRWWLGAFVLVAFGATTSLAADPQQPLWPAEGIEDFTLTECHGQTVTKADLLGRPWLACFIFTHCLGPCPVVSEQMEILQERLKGLDIRLVSITVDPDRDTAEVLRAYAARYHADPERWWFLTGDKDAIRRLIRRSFRMIVDDAAKPLPGFEIEHSITIMHVNAEGRVLGQYNARNDVDMARLRRLLLGAADAADTRLIEKADREDSEREAEQRRLQAEAERLAAEEEAAAQPPRVAPDWVYRLPTVNATLNGLATVLLLAGYGFIKAGRVEAHKSAMLSAFVTSILFLAFYLLYHFALHHYTGESSRRFTGVGTLLRTIYLTILITHVILAISVPVLAGITIYRGLSAQWERHKRIARITFPIWLYVSVTGVIIYLMLYHWPPAG